MDSTDTPVDEYGLPEDLLPFSDEALVVQLDARRQVFVEEYLVDLKAPSAALRAGFGPAMGAALLKEPGVAARIRVAMAQRLSRTRITQDTVLHEMSLLAKSDHSHYLVDDDGNVTLAEGAPEGAMRAIQSVKRKKTIRTDKSGDTYTQIDVEIKLWDKPTPLRLMGRHVGLFAEKMEHTGPNGGPIETITRIERVIVDPQQETR